eukprot:c20051_g1_i1 orf=125-1558(+)
MAASSKDVALVFFVFLVTIALSRRSSMELFVLCSPPPLHAHIAAVKATVVLMLYGAMAVMLLSKLRKKDVYLVDYACFRPPDMWRISYAAFLEHSAYGGVSEKNIEFERKILQHSGLGQQTALPPSYHFIPCRKGMEYSREEARTVFFTLLDDLFAKTFVDPSDIGILILNCCLFYPSPSLSAMLVNRYKMRASIKTFNISGMGCAASLLSIDMARHLLQVHSESYALVVSSENMSGRDYTGDKRSMLIANCLFRTGGAAALLSNRHADRNRSKYRLLHTMRTNTAADDRSFSCITHGEDTSGLIGVSLSKELMMVAGDALTKNITSLAHDVLPLSEKLRYVINLIARKVFNAQWKPYMPDFKLAFRHFCIHAGGKAVIQELEKNLRLTEEMTEASKMTLHRFGNTSSTSVWYELAYLEAMQKVKEGERVWQVGLGSGFKCFSAVWESMWNSKCTQYNPWMDCILNYPVTIPECVEF